jgi:hypothetical protein
VTWLTGARVERLTLVMRAVHGHPPPGPSLSPPIRAIWRVCDGPLDDVPRLVECLIGADLLEVVAGHIRTTSLGRRVATQDHQQGGTLLATALIDSGYFADQARQLIEHGTTELSSGDLVCRRDVAQAAAPQLCGLLRRWVSVQWAAEIRIPSRLVNQLGGVAALMPQREIDQADPRKEIGDRGEFYSYRFERERAADPSSIHWVARDDDRLGYDIEDISREPLRKIECKAGGSTATRFFVSANEWRVAHDSGDDYEFQYWGGVNLTRPLPAEYQVLRGVGYPRIYRNLRALLASGQLNAAPSQWEIVERNPYVAPVNEVTG